MNIWLCNYLSENYINRNGSARKRLINSFLDNGFTGSILLATDKNRSHYPLPDKLHYAFKSYCLKEAMDNGADIAIWSDCNMVLHSNISFLVSKIIENPIYLMKNAGWNTGQWTDDKCLNTFGITREQAFNISTVVSGFIAFDFRQKQSLDFFSEFYSHCNNPEVINGNRSIGCPDYGKNKHYGHRHDQSVLSLMANKYNINLLTGLYADPSNAIGVPNNPLQITEETIIKWLPN